MSGDRPQALSVRGQPLAVCVLGGSGFVGSRLAAHLCGLGHRVIIPTRSLVHHRHLQVLPNARAIQADVHDDKTLRQLMRNCDVAINLIGILNEPGRDGAGFRHAHVSVTEQLVAAAESAGIGKLVHLSALNANAESAPSHYLRSKGQAERIVAAQTAVAWTVLQPSVIFGPGDSFINRFAALLRRIPLFFPLARPDCHFAPVHVDDVVAAITRAVTDPATNGRTFQICGNEVYSLRELVLMTAAGIGVRRWVVGLPDGLARLQAILMEFFPGKPFSLDNYRSLTINSVCTERGLEELGIQARSLELNLRSCLGGLRSRAALDTYRRAAGR